MEEDASKIKFRCGLIFDVLTLYGLEEENRTLYDFIHTKVQEAKFTELWDRKQFCNILEEAFPINLKKLQPDAIKTSQASQNRPTMEDMLILFETVDIGYKGYINLNDLISAALLKDKVCERNFTISTDVANEVE